MKLAKAERDAQLFRLQLSLLNENNEAEVASKVAGKIFLSHSFSKLFMLLFYDNFLSSEVNFLIFT